MFIRFVIDEVDRDSGKRQGLFQAARRFDQSSDMNAHDRGQIEEISSWFCLHLPVPTRFAMSSHPGTRQQALSWFRDSANAHISKMDEFGNVLERNGIQVHRIKVLRPGRIIYEDEFQIAAYPFRDTAT